MFTSSVQEPVQNSQASKAMGANNIREGSGTPRAKSNATESKGGETVSEDLISVLLCGTCRAPITDHNNILGCREESVWAQQAFAYEVDLFADCPPLWCYSATNPQGRRFDIIRCTATAVNRYRTVTLSGPWSGEHSFFVGHKWCYASCNTCSSFLGWAFCRASEALSFSGGSTEDNDVQIDGGGCGSKTTDDDDDNVDEESIVTVGGNNSNNVSLQRDGASDDDGTVGFDPSVLSFLGLIVTNCVGRSGYSLRQYNELMNADPLLRRRFVGNSPLEDLHSGEDGNYFVSATHFLGPSRDDHSRLFVGIGRHRQLQSFLDIVRTSLLPVGAVIGTESQDGDGETSEDEANNSTAPRTSSHRSDSSGNGSEDGENMGTSPSFTNIPPHCFGCGDMADSIDEDVSSTEGSDKSD